MTLFQLTKTCFYNVAFSFEEHVCKNIITIVKCNIYLQLINNLNHIFEIHNNIFKVH